MDFKPYKDGFLTGSEKTGIYIDNKNLYLIKDGEYFSMTNNTFKDGYIKFDCPECGAPLEVWSDETVELCKAKGDWFPREVRYLIRHCENCHRDWYNEWWTDNGDVGETQLRRKFWG